MTAAIAAAAGENASSILRFFPQTQPSCPSGADIEEAVLVFGVQEVELRGRREKAD